MVTGEKITRESSGNNFINCLHRTDQRNIMDNSNGDSSASAWLQNCGAVWDVMLVYDAKSYDIISIDDWPRMYQLVGPNILDFIISYSDSHVITARRTAWEIRVLQVQAKKKLQVREAVYLPR